MGLGSASPQLSAFADTRTLTVSAKANSCARSAIVDPRFIVGMASSLLQLMQLIPTEIPEVFIIEPRVFGDERGFFMETYSARALAELGITRSFVQDNHSLSRKGTLRGLHYQLKNPQAKLCRVIRGAVWDVALDVRRGSPTFGQYASALLSAENKRMIYVPRGFAHGFLVLSDEAEFLYKCDDYYAPGDEYGVRFDDVAADIGWPLAQYGIDTPLLSVKDERAPLLGEVLAENLPLFSHPFTK